MGVLIDRVTATVKHKTKKQEGGFIGALLSPLVTSIEQPVIFLVVKGISGRGVRRAGRSEAKWMNWNYISDNKLTLYESKNKRKKVTKTIVSKQIMQWILYWNHDLLKLIHCNKLYKLQNVLQICNYSQEKSISLLSK